MTGSVWTAWRLTGTGAEGQPFDSGHRMTEGAISMNDALAIVAGEIGAPLDWESWETELLDWPRPQ